MLPRLSDSDSQHRITQWPSRPHQAETSRPAHRAPPGSLQRSFPSPSSSKPRTSASKGARIRLSKPKGPSWTKVTGRTSSRTLSISLANTKSSWLRTTRGDRYWVSVKLRKLIRTDVKSTPPDCAIWKPAWLVSREFCDATNSATF